MTRCAIYEMCSETCARPNARVPTIPLRKSGVCWVLIRLQHAVRLSTPQTRLKASTAVAVSNDDSSEAHVQAPRATCSRPSCSRPRLGHAMAGPVFSCATIPDAHPLGKWIDTHCSCCADRPLPVNGHDSDTIYLCWQCHHYSPTYSCTIGA